MSKMSPHSSIRHTAPSRYRPAFSDTINRILACDEPEGLSDHVIEPLCRMLGGTSAAFGHWSYEAKRLTVPANDSLAALSGTYALDNSLNVLYARDFCREDPVFRTIEARHGSSRRQRNAELVQLETVANPEEIPHSAFFQEFLIRAGIRDVLAIAVRPLAERGDLFIIGFHRDRRAEPFDKADAARLEPVAPAIANVISRLILREEGKYLSDITANLSGAPGLQACLLFDHKLRLVWINRAAQTALALTGEPPEGKTLDLLRAKCAALPIDLDYTRLSLAPRLSATVTRREQGRIFVLLDRPVDDWPMAASAEKLGLSSREAEVAQQVYHGLTSAQIGAQMGISERTVNNHLRSAYSKLGVHNRTSLLNRLLSAASG